MISAFTRCGGMLLAFLAAMALAGCGANSPSSTADEFMQALNRKDDAAAQALLTKRAREVITAGKSDTKLHRDKPTQFTIGVATIKDDTAEVPVTTKDDGVEHTLKLRMRREDGNWRIYAFVIPTAPGSDLVVDLEHPDAIASEALKAVGEAMAKGMKQLGEGMAKGMQAFGEGLAKGAKQASEHK